MSSDCVGWVFRYSPAKGATFQVHLAIGDSANDQHYYELWMRQNWLADKARVARKTCNEALDWLRENGLVDLLEEGRIKGAPNRYRFLMPEIPAVFDTREGGSHGYTRVGPTVTPGVKPGDTGVSPGVTQNRRSNSSTNASTGADKPPTTRRSQIPTPFSVTDDMQSWVGRRHPGLDWNVQTELFCTFHQAKGSVMKDWNLAWQNWMHKAAEFSSHRKSNKPVGSDAVAQYAREEGIL